MPTYDLDKTQEWLNRTMQLGKAPPVRGGVSPEPHARRHTVLSIGAAALVIILGMLLISWKRSGVRTSERALGPNVVEADSATKVPVIVAPPQSSYASSFNDRSSMGIHRPVPVHTPPVAVWSRTSLDGNVAPLPGHTAPPAPVWLDGAAQRAR